MKICNRNANASVSRITYLSSIYHNTHTRKGGLLLHRPPLCRWSRILLLNFCNSIDNPQGNQCRAWSIIIVQYTFTTSHRLKIFRPVCMELSMTYKNRAVCLSILIISNQFDRISCSEKVLPKIFIILFLIDKICGSAIFLQKEKSHCFLATALIIAYSLYCFTYRLTSTPLSIYRSSISAQAWLSLSAWWWSRAIP